LSVSALMMGLTGCGVGPPGDRASADGMINRAAFQGTGLKPGVELGWDNRLYRLVTTVPSTEVGPRLGVAAYHGNIGMFFTLYALVGDSISRGIVFQTPSGKFFEGIHAKP
jgi:hypothetical protein